MHPLTELIRADMKPALGVTEPGAIAYAAAKARSCLTEPVQSIHVTMNSGMYKNAFTCGIPNSTHFGAAYAAALGAIAGNAGLELEALRDITPEDNETAAALVGSGNVSISVGEITSRIYIRATVRAGGREASVTIEDSHTNITRIEADGKVLFERTAQTEQEVGENAEIHRYTLGELLDYVRIVDVSELSFLHEAFRVNLALFEEGRASDRLTFLPGLLAENGGVVFSDDAQKTASLLCNGAIEARVLGLSRPAMSVTGSGAHGIIATLPLYAAAKVEGYPDDALIRATALSALVCMYIKEYSGKLSAFCGCAIAAGTGMACGLALLRGGDLAVMERVIPQSGVEHHRHDLRRRQSGLHDEGHRRGRRGLSGGPTGAARDRYFPGAWHLRRNARGNDAQYGAHRLAGHGRHGKDHDRHSERKIGGIY